MVYRRTKRFAKSALKLPFRTGRYAIRGAEKFNKTLATAVAAYKGVKMLRGLVNSERMYRDQTLTLSGQSMVFPLCNFPQGDNIGQRTGNSVLVRSLAVRGNVAINSAVTSNTRLTIMLIQDMQQVASTTPATSDILASGNDPDSLLSLTNAGRFKVLWRKNYLMLPQTSGSRNAIELQKYFNLYTHVRFNGTSSTAIQKGGLYLVVVSSESTNFPSGYMNVRLGYHDN